jgi:hypothetical protein
MNFAEASGNENTLYTAALYASKTIEEIASAKKNNTLNGPQVIFQQVRPVPRSISLDPSHLLTPPPPDLHKRQPLSNMGRDSTC